LEFDIAIIPYEGNDNWVEPMLFGIQKFLKSDLLPPQGNDCDFCKYREAAAKVTS